MKNLIICCLTVLLFSCKNNPSDHEDTVMDQPTTTTNDSIARSESNYANRIIPGKRLGNIVLDENSSKVMDSLGKPDSGDAAMGKAISTWHENSQHLLSIYTTTKMGVEDFSRIKAIRSLSPDFHTDGDLGVYSTLDEIQQKFHLNEIGTFVHDNKTYTLYGGDTGIGFEIGEDHKCNGIVITEEGNDADQLYLSFYPDLKKKQIQ